MAGGSEGTRIVRPPRSSSPFWVPKAMVFIFTPACLAPAVASTTVWAGDCPGRPTVGGPSLINTMAAGARLPAAPGGGGWRGGGGEADDERGQRPQEGGRGYVTLPARAPRGDRGQHVDAREADHELATGPLHDEVGGEEGDGRGQQQEPRRGQERHRPASGRVETGAPVAGAVAGAGPPCPSDPAWSRAPRRRPTKPTTSSSQS